MLRTASTIILLATGQLFSQPSYRDTPPPTLEFFSLGASVHLITTLRANLDLLEPEAIRRHYRGAMGLLNDLTENIVLPDEHIERIYVQCLRRKK